MAKPLLFDPVASPYLVPFDGSFRIDKARTEAKDRPDKKDNNAAVAASVEKLARLQGVLAAQDRYAALFVFQALDAAGKDGTIRAVFSGVNPAGCSVTSFKQPSPHELDHDFLWRVQMNLPPRGDIGVWNRSHYEEVLVVRVHPEYLDNQRLPRRPKEPHDMWTERFESINDAEKHWARNGTVIVKFFLHVSQNEQHKRFLDRIEDPDANWKFNAGDLKESRRYADYQTAYEHALNATSTLWAPWYCIPADSKSHMRRLVSEIIVDTMSQLHLEFPKVSDAERAEMKKVAKELEKELDH